MLVGNSDCREILFVHAPQCLFKFCSGGLHEPLSVFTKGRIMMGEFYCERYQPGFVVTGGNPAFHSSRKGCSSSGS